MPYQVEHFRGGAEIIYQGRRYGEGDVIETLSPEALRVYLARGWVTNTDSAVTQGQLDVTPAARALAEEYGLDLYLIRGSGAGGRITMPDVEAVLPLDEDEDEDEGEDSPWDYGEEESE